MTEDLGRVADRLEEHPGMAVLSAADAYAAARPMVERILAVGPSPHQEGLTARG